MTCAELFWLGVGTGFVAGVAGTLGGVFAVLVWKYIWRMLTTE